MKDINKIKKEIIYIGNELWSQGFTPANAGNFSVKLDDNTLLCTATGISKNQLTPETIIRTDLQGNPIDENSKFSPSSEIKMHIEAYKCRADIRVVLHAHPVFATTFASMGKDLNDNVLPEATLQLGSIPVAKYGTPSTTELSNSIIEPLQISDAILLENHGVIVVADSLKMAQFKIEILEHYCHILYNLNCLKQSKRLTDNQVLQLIELRKSNKIQGKALIKYSTGEVQF
jgi:L-fuculose-phosphate aldolase